MSHMRFGGEEHWLSDERRRANRIPKVVRTTLRTEGRFVRPVEASTLDLCEDGALLVSNLSLHDGQRINLEFECELPVRVHLGFDASSLVIDGPLHTYLLHLDAVVVRSRVREDNQHEIGVSFSPTTDWGELSMMQSYMEHLRHT